MLRNSLWSLHAHQRVGFEGMMQVKFEVGVHRSSLNRNYLLCLLSKISFYYILTSPDSPVNSRRAEYKVAKS